MTKEALNLALEALETCNWFDDGEYGHAEYDHVSTSKAITAIKAALEAKDELVCVCGAVWEGQELVIAPKEEAKDEPDAYGYAKRLAEAIWSKHYKTIAPQWEPFDELIGVLTQIDNMTAGLISTPQQEAKDEPEAWRWMPAPYWKQWVYSDDGKRVKEAKRFMGDGGVQPLYTTPPQRTWVGLTDEEVKKIVGSDRYTDLLKEVVQIVEAKLRSKNSG